jgi:hypothetical protein
MALPHYPGDHDEPPTQPSRSRTTVLVVAAGAALVVLVLVLHLTGVIGH